LLREAVHGTMSNFYMARDKLSGQIVGLKILDPEKTRTFEERFRGLDKPSEGEIAMGFDHPRIVRTLEHGLTTDDEPYLVMEYLEGQGLNTLISAESELLLRRGVELLRDAAEATAFVHKTGYIHRDICPRNFVVSLTGDSLKLIDFGLTVPATTPFMQRGNRTGTPRYMAPEVVRRRTTDQRLDVFSFGVTAFETLALRPPWPSVVTGQDAMTHDSQPPADLRELRPDIDPDLADAIHRCIEPDPQRRLPSIQHFLEIIAAM